MTTGVTRASGGFAVRVGCDLQPVEDVARAVADLGARYLDRVYTPAEQRALAAGGAASLAARFAAKEAVLKLLGPDGVDPRDVEVVSEDRGRPTVVLHGVAASRARDAGLGPIALSLSHTSQLAMAVAVAAVAVPPAAVASDPTQGPVADPVDP